MLFDFIERFWFINPSTDFFIGGGGGAAASYQITNSVRLRATASPYLSRSMPAPTNNLKWTLSKWLKRGDISTHCILGSGTAPSFIAQFNSTGNFQIYIAGTSYFVTSQVFRDPSAWMHLVLAYDSANATQADRIILYVNGVRASTTTASCPSSQATGFNASGVVSVLGRPLTGWYGDARDYFDGHLSDIYFVDGQALTPSSFAEQNSDGVWVPKAYTGTYGTNGFHLDFKDAALTSGSNVGLGKDVSGNGNYWTTNNISVTAGVTYDSMVDTPTNNYATLNPIVGTFAGTLADAALKFTSNATTAYSTIAVSTGKWWWEVVVSTVGADPYIGMMDSTYIKGDNLWASEFYAYKANGQKYNGSAAAYGATYTSSDVLGFALDVDTGTIEVYKQTGGAGAFASQGVMFNSGVSGKTWRPAIYGGASSTVAHFNAGQRPFSYVTQHGALPTGFKALCTANLPAVAIAKPASYFNAKTRVGTGAAFNVTGEAFAPDLVWSKGRSGATDHAIYDTIRGVQKDIGSNLATDQTTQAQGITAFNLDGFTGGTLAKLNTNAATYIDWMWKESVTAGLDIVAVTGNGANRTVAHNLGVVPKMIIGKSLTTAGADTGWPVYHASLANTEYLMLNTTAAKATGATYWNSTTPTSSVFSLGTAADVNTNADTYIYYVFAEIPGFSKFGSYVGNGSADGPFVYCGFRPKYLLIKTAVSAANAWYIHDAARDTYNQMNHKLYPDVSTAENTAADNMIDFTANGFKVRSANTSTNDTSTMIFAAFADYPFGGSNVAPSPAR